MSSISATRSPEAIKQCMAGEAFQNALTFAESAKATAIVSAGITGLGLTVGGPTTFAIGASGLVASGISYLRARGQMEDACGPESLKMPAERVVSNEVASFSK